MKNNIFKITVQEEVVYEKEEVKPNVTFAMLLANRALKNEISTELCF